jgi:SOS-response transcriptional repressor LexA
MPLSVAAQRFKQLREELGYTQSAFAERLGIKNTTADIERGKVKITGHIVKDLLSQFNVNPMWLYGDSKQQYLNIQSQNVAPQVVSVDNQGLENILMVNVKAAAGYSGNINDQQFYNNLPAFSFPLPEYRNTSFRGFQVEGDSMSPAILENDWILAKALSNIDELKDGDIHVVVEDESVRVKKVRKLEDTLQLISLNKEYSTVEIAKSSVKELWVFHSKISKDVDTQLHGDMLRDIKSDLEEIKNKL